MRRPRRARRPCRCGRGSWCDVRQSPAAPRVAVDECCLGEGGPDVHAQQHGSASLRDDVDGGQDQAQRRRHADQMRRRAAPDRPTLAERVVDLSVAQVAAHRGERTRAEQDQCEHDDQWFVAEEVTDRDGRGHQADRRTLVGQQGALVGQGEPGVGVLVVSQGPGRGRRAGRPRSRCPRSAGSGRRAPRGRCRPRSRASSVRGARSGTPPHRATRPT